MAQRHYNINEIHQIIFEPGQNSERSSISDVNESFSSCLSENDEESEQENDTANEQDGSEDITDDEVQTSSQRTAKNSKNKEKPKWGKINESITQNYPKFSGKNHGPTHCFQYDSKPVAFFDQIFPEELWETLLNETNRYADQKNVQSWTATTKEELRCFVGFLYGTSINKISQIDDVWSSDWVVGSPAFARFFTRDRFWALMANIHLADNESALPKRHKDFDKLYKLRPMLRILKESFQKNYNMGQNVSVDEAMVKGKGRNPIKQYMPMKPIKRGSKIWCIGCACCGYLWDFQIYAGKDNTSEVGLSTRVVCDLCHPALDNLGHVVYIDNFFTSIELCMKLKKFGTYTVGTLRPNRRWYPECLKSKALLKNMKRGDYNSVSADGITATVWSDTKVVSFLSNVHSSKGNTEVSRKSKDGTHTKYSAPPVVLDYNAHMGAVDKNDQLKKTYAIDRKNKRWWLRILFHFLDICRVNAYIMYRENFDHFNSGPLEEDTNAMTQKEFSSSLIKSLCGSFSSRKQIGRPSLSPLPFVLSDGHESVNMVKHGGLKRRRCCECTIGPNKKKARRVETVYGCLSCNVRLCRDKCHDIYHQRLQSGSE